MTPKPPDRMKDTHFEAILHRLKHHFSAGDVDALYAECRRAREEVETLKAERDALRARLDEARAELERERFEATRWRGMAATWEALHHKGMRDHDAISARCARLTGALLKHCNGRVQLSCRLCGDSTFDHECEDREVECPLGCAAALRDDPGEPADRGMEIRQAVRASLAPERVDPYSTPEGDARADREEGEDNG